jgi:nitrous oxide reductase accessory protein NosL
MDSRSIGLAVSAFLTALFIAAPANAAGTADLPDGSKLDLTAACPVCSMKLDSSELGPAALVLKDRKVIGFDGPGDLFRYMLDPSKYGLKPEEIKELYVTEYGAKTFIDAKKAFFVVGSGVTGAMGLEAVPFSKREDADKFKAERQGKGVAAFWQLKLEDLQSEKKMLKMKH